MPKLNPLQLTTEERQQLEEIIGHGERTSGETGNGFTVALARTTPGNYRSDDGGNGKYCLRLATAVREEGLKGLYYRPKSGRPRKK